MPTVFLREIGRKSLNCPHFRLVLAFLIRFLTPPHGVPLWLTRN